MRTQQSPCDQQFVARFLADELSDRETQEFEAHLAACESCRRQLADQTASEGEWDTLRRSLQDSDDHFSTALRDPASDELSGCRQLLGPTDDPRMMGRIGTYEVTGLLGRGGMGIVFKALDTALNRYVAIKMLAPMFLASGSSKQRFLREAQSAAAVVHEHVVGIHGISEWQGTPYLVMTYVRGESLQSRLAARGPLSLREVLRIGAQIASGLAAAHAQGLIHRDIKPANILLESGVDRVMITDFGLARAIDDLRITGTNTLLGTPEYMSPEQARDEPLDFRTDLFSLGCVLYEASTGRSPFRASTSYGAIQKVTESSPPSVRRLVPDLPEWFARLVARLLAKAPADRISTANKLAALLTNCLAHVEQPDLVPLPVELHSSLRQPLQTRLTRNLLMTSTLILAVCVGVSILWAQVGRPPAKNVQRPAVARSQTESAADRDDTERRSPSTNASPAPQSARQVTAAPVDGQPIAKAGPYTLKVRKSAPIDQFGLAIKPANHKHLLESAMNGKGLTVRSQSSVQRSEQSSSDGSQSASSSNESSSQSSATIARTGEQPIRPNLGVVFDVSPKENVILEFEDLEALDDDRQPVRWMGPGPFNFYDPAFEAQTRGALVAYFQEAKSTDHLKAIVGELKATPGRIHEVSFPQGTPSTQTAGGYSFTLKELQRTPEGIQISLELPRIGTPRGNLFGDPQAALQAMLEQQGACEVLLEDNTGAIHYPSSSASGSSSSSGNSGSSSSSESSGFSFGNNSTKSSRTTRRSQKSDPPSSGKRTTSGNSSSSSSTTLVGFPPLPDTREIKAVIVRATERTGQPQTYPFTLDAIPVPYTSE